MPPENMNERSEGSPTTIRAPSLARMMSSRPWRSSVPGAIREIAARSFGSSRGSADGVRVKALGESRVLPSRLGCLGLVCTEPRCDGLPKRVRLEDSQFAICVRAGRNERSAEAQLRALVNPALSLHRRTEPSREADLRKRREPLIDRDAFRGRGDGE